MEYGLFSSVVSAILTAKAESERLERAVWIETVGACQYQLSLAAQPKADLIGWACGDTMAWSQQVKSDAAHQG